MRMRRLQFALYRRDGGGGDGGGGDGGGGDDGRPDGGGDTKTNVNA